MDCLVIISLFLLSMAILFHGIGIYCIYRTKLNGNQKLMLSHLSIVEVLIALSAFIGKLLALKYKIYECKGLQYVALFYMGANFVYYLLMMLISIDRILCIYWNIKYKYRMTKGRVLRTIILLWLLGFGISLPFYVTPFKKASGILSKICVPALDIAFIILTMIVYFIIALKLHQRKKKFPRLGRRRKRSIFRKKYFVIPFCIVLSFTIFYVIPDLLLAVGVFGRRRILMNIIYCWWCISLLLDPFIYVFFNEEARKAAFSIIKGTHEDQNLKDVQEEDLAFDDENGLEDQSFRHKSLFNSFKQSNIKLKNTKLTRLYLKSMNYSQR